MFDQRMADLLLMKAPEQTLAFYRHGLVFVFNFHFGNSLNNVLIPVHQPGEYTVVLSTDDEKYGGFGNVAKKTYSSKRFNGKDYIELYIPARTGFVLKEKAILTVEEPKKAEEKAPAVEEPPAKKRTGTRKSTSRTQPKAAAAEGEKPARKRTVKEPAGEKPAAEAQEKKTTRKRTTKKTEKAEG